ncbi:hypothetical protein F5X68DRAFT_272635 [Plectosphaerella plurivora]|uniref:Arrestin-like N-terminal domain-containing protein n=1 Tax=Plectosphaerella plurivora TaxID=936078 RepID=A0A9P8VLH1_9PEZI|nr:hypothetical protein F5X68DRAFT_272635 [Plectosphaerella plurivora]
MGITVRRGGMAFDIKLEGAAPNAWYAPGDTLIGYVSRAVATVSPSATVKITICGRTKSKIVVSRGNNNRSYYRSRFDVINEHDHQQTIYHGPLHIATQPGAHTEPSIWPFAVEIPKHCCPLRTRVPADESYVPLDDFTVTTTPLPNSFHMDHPGWSSDRQGFVEYFLKAHITFTHGGSYKTDEAFLPINIRTGDPNPPITDFKLRRYRHVGNASTYKLLPGMEDAELSFSQKRQELMGSSKVPRLGGHMEIDIPQVLQIDNPGPVHLQLRFVPDDKLTANGMHGVPAKIALQSLAITITSWTTVLCSGSFSPHDRSDDHEASFRLWPPRGVAPPEPLYIPCTGEWPPIDIGERVGFRLPDYMCKRVPSRSTSDVLSPGFSTYNIKHWHTMSIKLVAVVAGREMKMSVLGKLTILPPAAGVSLPPQVGSNGGQEQEEAPPPPFQARTESWIHPPAEEDAPPSFAEVQKDDMIRKSSDGSGEEKAGKGEGK